MVYSVWCAGVISPPWEGWKFGVRSRVLYPGGQSDSLLVLLFKMASEVADLYIRVSAAPAWVRHLLVTLSGRLCHPGTVSPVPGLKTQPGNSESGRTRVGMAFADPSPLSLQNCCCWGEVGARSSGGKAGANRASSFLGEGQDGAFRCLWSRPPAQVGPKRTARDRALGTRVVGGAQQLRIGSSDVRPLPRHGVVGDRLGDITGYRHTLLCAFQTSGAEFPPLLARRFQVKSHAGFCDLDVFLGAPLELGGRFALSPAQPFHFLT